MGPRRGRLCPDPTVTHTDAVNWCDLACTAVERSNFLRQRHSIEWRVLIEEALPDAYQGLTPRAVLDKARRHRFRSPIHAEVGASPSHVSLEFFVSKSATRRRRAAGGGYAASNGLSEKTSAPASEASLHQLAVRPCPYGQDRRHVRLDPDAPMEPNAAQIYGRVQHPLSLEGSSLRNGAAIVMVAPSRESSSSLRF